VISPCARKNFVDHTLTDQTPNLRLFATALIREQDLHF
jgi:hypothetical protein